MHRLQVQLEEEVYQLLRQEAFVRGVSISELVRRIVRRYLEAGGGEASGVSLSFVGMGESTQGRLAPVSERHDEALWEV